METTHDSYDDQWAWPCPYCRSQNAIEAAVCGACRAQLRDPDEDHLFTTVATENAQIVAPHAPAVREVLWSTEVTPSEEVAEEVVSPTGAGSGASPFGPSRAPRRLERDQPSPVAPGVPPADPPRMPQVSPTAFGEAPAGMQGDPRPGVDTHVTPDENGLSVAVEHLQAPDRERCAVPISVCGALLGEQEVVLGMLAGYLMGHASVLMVTNSRVLVANARRWKPLLDQYLPSQDLVVHLRHDRDVASLTLVQGSRLTTLDGVSDIAGAMELAELIRGLTAVS